MLFVLLTKILLMKSYDDKISVVYLFIKIFNSFNCILESFPKYKPHRYVTLLWFLTDVFSGMSYTTVQCTLVR